MFKGTEKKKSKQQETKMARESQVKVSEKESPITNTQCTTQGISQKELITGSKSSRNL